MSSFDFSDEERQVCMDTWAAMPGSLQENGMQWFINMFQKYPDMKKLYRFLDHYKGDMAANPELPKHVMRVMKKINVTITQQDNPSVMAADLKALGARHPGYAVRRSKHVQPTEDTFMAMLKSRMGSKWTASVEKCWRKCFGEIVNIMLDS